MRLNRTRTHSFRISLAAFAAGLLLAGCGLASGGGNLEAGAKYQAEGNYRAAYIEAKKALQKNEKDGEAWLLLGQSSLLLGNPDDALTELGKAKENGAEEGKWVVPLGRALLVSQQFNKLLATLPANGAFTPGVKARVEALRGDAQIALKQLDLAKQSFESALQSDPNNPYALVGLAKLAVIGKDPDSAAKYMKQALASSPDNPQAIVMQADLALDNHDLAAAEAGYQKAIDLKNADWLPQERYYALARLANAQVQQDHLDKALASIATLEKMAPKQPFPHFLKAAVLFRQGHLDDAITALQQVLQATPDDPRAQLLMGNVNYAKGNYAQAEMYLSNALGMDQNNAEARKLLALTYYREGRSQQALDTLRPLVPGQATDAQLLATLQRAAAEGAATPKAANAGTAPAPAESPIMQAGQALVSGNESEAIHLLETMPAGSASDEARRTILLVVGYAREKRTGEAVKVAADYAAKHPKDSGAHLLYGTALVVDGKRDQAREQYNEAVKLDPKNVAALLSLGSLDTLDRKFDDAAGRYNQVLKIDSNNAVAMTALGTLAMQKNDRSGAIQWFQRAIAASPKTVQPYVALVMLYSQARQFDDAITTAQKLVSEVPNNAMGLNALGAAQLAAGHNADALKPLQQAVQLDPNVPLYRVNLARAQILNKDPKAAEASLDEVIAGHPYDANAVGMRAFLKVQDKDLPGAVALARTLQKNDATRLAGLTLEGDVYMAGKSYADAAKAYQKALQANDSRALVVRTFEALSRSGAKEPQGVLTDWLAKHSDDAAVRMLLAQYYLGQSQNAQAASEYETVLKAYPSNVGALNNLAWIYTEQHDPKGLELAGKAYKLAPKSASVADTYAWSLVAADRSKEALPILATAAKAAPQNADIQYHLAVAQANTGDKAGARTTLEALAKIDDANFRNKQDAEKLLQSLGGSAGGNQ